MMNIAQNIQYFAILLLAFLLQGLQAQNTPQSPLPVIDFSECDRFFSAFNNRENQRKAITAYFLDTVTNPGMKALVMKRPIDFMVDRLLGFSDYYKNLGIAYEKMKVKLKNDKTFKEYYAAFKRVYPWAAPPKIIFSVSALATAGTVTNDGVVTALEFYGKGLSEQEKSSVPKYLQSFLMVLEDWSGIMFHEQMHYQQQLLYGKPLSYDDVNSNDDLKLKLLNHALVEGGADFVSNLFSGFATKMPYYQYGIKHEKTIWQAFKKDMAAGKTFKDPEMNLKWGRTMKPHPVYPPDLVYFIGSQICKHYYEKQSDKARAIKAMFDCISSSEKVKKLLDDSGYDDHVNGLKEESF